MVPSAWCGCWSVMRQVLGHAAANSTEFVADCEHPVVIFMPEGSKTHMGGTMRLGARRTVMQRNDCQACKLYGGASMFDERHRHRYEVNIEYVPAMEAKGLEFVGRDTTGGRPLPPLSLRGALFGVVRRCQASTLVWLVSLWAERMEVLELQGHPYFIAAQYHPEFKSRPLKPSPLFYGLVCAASGVKPEYFPDA